MSDRKLIQSDDGKDYFLNSAGEVYRKEWVETKDGKKRYVDEPIGKYTRDWTPFVVAVISGVFALVAALFSGVNVVTNISICEKLLCDQKSILTAVPEWILPLETDIETDVFEASLTNSNITSIPYEEVNPTLTATTQTHSPEPTNENLDTTPSGDDISTSLPGLTTTVNLITRGQLNHLLGDSNWFCFPNARNIIGVRQLPSSFVVQNPITFVDTSSARYSSNAIVQDATGATIYLNDQILQSECPLEQQDALEQWINNSNNRRVSANNFNELFGDGNWRCSDQFSYLVVVSDLNADLFIEFPVTNVDRGSMKYGIGDIVPRGGMISVWTIAMSQDECP
ncbi:MAG: hypothetical protein SF029_18970 [bacterium]|nr:hypothetical protein [bacterium]